MVHVVLRLLIWRGTYPLCLNIAYSKESPTDMLPDHQTLMQCLHCDRQLHPKNDAVPTIEPNVLQQSPG